MLEAQPLTLSGAVRDGSTNEPLPLANIFVRSTTTGTVTNDEGKFTLALPSGDYELLVSFIGYKTEVVHVSLRTANIALSIRLFPTDLLLQEVTVYSTSATRAELAEVSALSLQSKRITEITSVIPDVLRSVHALPGVAADNEFSAKFNVRGGNYDENLVLVNGAQVYEPFHIKEAPNASIGIFHVDLMKKVDIITGGFSARYGDRMSSVLNIEYREGSKEHYAGTASISMTDVSGFLEGPIGEEGSFIIGARKSYLEYIMSFLDVDPRVHPSFYDVQGVVAYSLSSRNKLLFEFIHAGDHYTNDPYAEARGPFVGSGTYKGQPATFREGSQEFDEDRATYFSNLFDIQSTNFLSSTAFSKLEISYYDQSEEEYSYNLGSYSNTITSNQNYFYRSTSERLRDNNLRIKTLETSGSLDVQITPFFEIRTGAAYQNILYSQHLIDRRIRDISQNMDRFPDTTNTRLIENAIDAANESIEARSFKLAAYAENIVQLGDAIIFNAGGRLDYFGFNRDLTLSPRLSASFKTTVGTTLRAAWGLYYQSPIYRQLAYSFASDTNTQSQRAVHYILGAEHTVLLNPLTNNSLTVKAEVYLKNYGNLISSTRSSDGRISYSRKNDASGSVTGADFYAVLNTQGFYGWISYGLLFAKEDLHNDRIGSYPRYTDQRHTLSIVADLDWGKGWSTNLRAVYGSGFAFTPYSSQYNSTKRSWEWKAGEKNSDHLPAYERVDVRLSREFTLWNTNVVSFVEVSNVFDFKNIQSYRYRFDRNGYPYKEEVLLWPLVPSFGMTVQF